MTTDNTFCLLDWTLLLLGTKLVRTRTVHGVVQLSILLVTLPVTAMDIVINLHEGMGLDAIRPQVKLQTIRYTARAVFPMLVQIALVIKTNHLKSLLEDILHDVKRTDKMKLQNISVISLIAVYLTYSHPAWPTV
ncbi:hypothetical protein HDE_04223 [Halotydeus destructor]|nr:hypothetical protein HDE_04223 [Halotydeus destructor]